MQNETVADRIAAKLKSSEFGAWFGEDDLLALTREAITRAFLTERRNPAAGRYNEPDRLPPLIVEHAEKYVDGRINDAVIEVLKTYVAENPELVTEAVEKAVSVGIDKIILRVISNVITGGMVDFQATMQQRLSDTLRSRL